MVQTVHLVCPRCGHPEMHVVESAENDAPIAEVAEDASTLEAIRQRRLKSLPTSLPVGGIITPV